MGREFLRIKEAIKENGFTYESIGSAVGLTKTSIARIASGDQTPSFDTLKRIADTLDVDIRDLFHPTKDNAERYYIEEGTGKRIRITEL